MSRLQHAISEEPQTRQAGQDGFEQHLAEARLADPAPVGSGASYPHRSTEDRDLIDTAIAQYAAQNNSLPNTAAAPFTFRNTAMLLPYLGPLLRNCLVGAPFLGEGRSAPHGAGVVVPIRRGFSHWRALPPCVDRLGVVVGDSRGRN